MTHLGHQHPLADPPLSSKFHAAVELGGGLSEALSIFIPPNVPTSDGETRKDQIHLMYVCIRYQMISAYMCV